jgi:hypothetical protein
MKPQIIPEGFLPFVSVELFVMFVCNPADGGTWIRSMLFVYGVYDCVIWIVLRYLERTGRGIKERGIWHPALLASSIPIAIAFSVWGIELFVNGVRKLYQV